MMYETIPEEAPYVGKSRVPDVTTQLWRSAPLMQTRQRICQAKELQRRQAK